MPIGSAGVIVNLSDIYNREALVAGVDVCASRAPRALNLEMRDDKVDQLGVASLA
jgi:hypothetical protein